jgi:5-methylcytosine-specific restriction endonuclease McrA
MSAGPGSVTRHADHFSIKNKHLTALPAGGGGRLLFFYERHIEQDDCAGAEPQLAGDQHSHAAGRVLPNGHERCHRARHRAGREPHPPGDLGRVDHAAGARGRQRRAHRARRDPRADGHRGGELCQGAEEAPEAQRPNIRERDGNRCQYTGRCCTRTEGNLDHVVPRSRGGADTWENLVWSART